MTELLEEDCMKELFPINSLRNAAVLFTRTPLVFVGDGAWDVSLKHGCGMRACVFPGVDNRCMGEQP